MTGKKGQTSEKAAEVPERFAPGFLLGMDRRKVIPRAVALTMAGLVEAVGGDPSPQVQLLIEHGTWTHMRLRQLQAQFIDSGEFDYKQHSALLNSLTGVLRSIGLERRAKPAENLQDYMRRVTAEDQRGGTSPG